MMKKTLWTTLLIAFIFVGTAHAQATDTEYRQIALNIIDDVKGLKEDFKHFEEVDKDGKLDERDEPFWIAYDYENEMKWVKSKESQDQNQEMVKTFSKGEGVDLALYFYKGQWAGQSPVRPFNIGDLNVVAFVEGEETEDIQEIRARVGQIVLVHKIAFEKAK